MAFIQTIPHSHPSLKRPLWASALLHLFAILFFFFAPILPIFKPATKVIWVQLPKGVSEEIDLKMKEAENLPKTTIKEQKEWLKKPEETKDKKTVKAKEEKPKLTPIRPKPKPKPLTAEQKALAALEKKMKAPPEAAQVPEKGEGFKYGTAMEPLRVPPTDPEYLAYQAKVRYKIIEEWILPLAYLEGDVPPRGRMIVQINQNGDILSKEWDEKSGNAAFDASCERAISRATPLPVPPERLKWEAYNEGFLVEFDPSLKGE
ncbi:MAG: cell envelope integrity protein TolA [Deltaproteobacteria bacterium]|nr:cell envelope integrity protein TolA [Deltaproteobacteria bacterium]